MKIICHQTIIFIEGRKIEQDFLLCICSVLRASCLGCLLFFDCQVTYIVGYWKLKKFFCHFAIVHIHGFAWYLVHAIIWNKFCLHDRFHSESKLYTLFFLLSIKQQLRSRSVLNFCISEVHTTYESSVSKSDLKKSNE